MLATELLLVNLFLLLLLLALNPLLLSHLFHSILQIKPGWQLKVQLNCSTLVLSAEHIEQLYIYLWSVESPISLIDFVVFPEFNECMFQLLFSHVPILKLAQILLRTSRQFDRVFEPKYRINVVE